MNPDGVIAGHYRSSFAGHDLNKMFLLPDEKIHPSVYHFKNLIESTKDKIFAYIDIQGHWKKKCTYLYGPEFPLHDQNYFKVRVLPKILDSLCEHFRFHSCAFHVNKHNERTARVVLFRNFDINLWYVFGASFQGYLNKERKNEEFTLDKYIQTGKNNFQLLFMFYYRWIIMSWIIPLE